MKLHTIRTMGKSLAVLSLVSINLPVVACAQEAAENQQIGDSQANGQLTREACLALNDRSEKIACLTELRAQRETEIDTRTQRVRSAQAEQATKVEQLRRNDESIAANEESNEQRRATVRGLEKVIDIQEGRTKRPK